MNLFKPHRHHCLYVGTTAGDAGLGPTGPHKLKHVVRTVTLGGPGAGDLIAEGYGTLISASGEFRAPEEELKKPREPGEGLMLGRCEK